MSDTEEKTMVEDNRVKEEAPNAIVSPAVAASKAALAAMARSPLRGPKLESSNDSTVESGKKGLGVTKQGTSNKQKTPKLLDATVLALAGSEEPTKKGIKTPLHTDVLLGRGGLSNNHHGNKTYNAELETRAWEYSQLKGRKAKTKFAREIVYELKGQGTRFLHHARELGVFFEAEDDDARKKVSQRLRELALNTRVTKALNPSDDSKTGGEETPEKNISKEVDERLRELGSKRKAVEETGTAAEAPKSRDPSHLGLRAPATQANFRPQLQGAAAAGMANPNMMQHFFPGAAAGFPYPFQVPGMPQPPRLPLQGRNYGAAANANAHHHQGLSNYRAANAALAMAEVDSIHALASLRGNPSRYPSPHQQAVDHQVSNTASLVTSSASDPKTQGSSVLAMSLRESRRYDNHLASTILSRRQAEDREEKRSKRKYQDPPGEARGVGTSPALERATSDGSTTSSTNDDPPGDTGLESLQKKRKVADSRGNDPPSEAPPGVAVRMWCAMIEMQQQQSKDAEA